MSNSLKDLLKDAVKRANISRGVLASQIVFDTNQYLKAQLPSEAARLVRAISYVGGVVHIACTHSAASQFVSERTEPLMQHLKSRHPSAPLERIQTRVVPHFPSSEL